MKVSEIFYSIEGEGIEIGRPEIFVRLAGCNLRCEWCDTKYALENGKEMELREVVDEIKRLSCQSVSITGGEPLLQSKELTELGHWLKKSGYWIQLNTNGTIFNQEIFEMVDLISMDCKCPSSKMKSVDSVLKKTKELFNNKTQFKCVISNKKDFEYAFHKVKSILQNADNIVFQPEWNNKDFSSELADLVKEDKCNVKMIMQQHKMIWGNKRAV